MTETADRSAPSLHGTSGGDERNVVWLDVVPLRTAEPSFARRREPVKVGIPFPRGLLRQPVQATLQATDGYKSPIQVRVLDRWSDDTVRWALFDFQVSTAGGPSPVGTLDLSHAVKTPTGVRIEETATGREIVIDTGVARFRLETGGQFPFAEVLIDGRPAIRPDRTSLTIEDSDGVVSAITVKRIEVKEAGPLRTVLALDGTGVRGERTRGLEIECQLEFVAESAAVRFSLTLRNSRRAKHPGGIWVLGDAGSVYIRDMTLTIGAPSSAVIRCSPECGSPLEEWPGPFELYQDSSGGENWRSTNHVNRKRVVPLTFRGYRLRAGDIIRSGERATPILSLKYATGELSVAMRDFWQNFPKALEATHDSLVLRLFPRQHADVHEIQGGEQKTHVFVLAFGPDAVTDIPLAWVREPVLVRARPEWYASTGAVPYMVPKQGDPHPLYRELIDAAIEGSDTFEHKRDVLDEYGWRHFGDVYGDHEATRSSAPTPLVSHYNNQYDPIAGFARQFMSTGDPRWWAYFDELAAHVVDIDIYHTADDKAAYNGGMFWHTVHYTEADTSTHRSYPRLPGVHGGGPSAQHNYPTGLMLHYFVTGDVRSRDAAVDLARFVINMDDGRKSRWWWIDWGSTGVATFSGTVLYHGPGRGSGNSLSACIDGHQLTRDRAFLSKAEEIIRRCVNPADNIDARTLLDAERRWYYTMLLQALGKYLDHKVELGETDDMYSYARASLLHYARWMAQNEYPYLQKPEILEFPTETWPAQDMRKSDALNFAARHSTGQERERFLERARFFFDNSVATLLKMPTHTLARPVVVLLTSGVLQSYVTLHGDVASPTPDARPVEYGPPATFVAQRVRVKRRLIAIAAVMCMTAAMVFLYFVVR